MCVTHLFAGVDFQTELNESTKIKERREINETPAVAYILPFIFIPVDRIQHEQSVTRERTTIRNELM